MSERLRRDEIPEREGFLQRRDLQIVCKGPAASGKGKGTRSVANPGERDSCNAEVRQDGRPEITYGLVGKVLVAEDHYPKITCHGRRPYRAFYWGWS